MARGPRWVWLLLLLLVGCSRAMVGAPPPVAAPPPPVTSPPPPGSAPPPVGAWKAERGKASWYGAPHHGRQTASGEIYDMHELTAAHRTFPLGSRVLVTNLDNGEAAEVRINDRGPFAHGRI